MVLPLRPWIHHVSLSHQPSQVEANSRYGRDGFSWLVSQQLLRRILWRKRPDLQYAWCPDDWYSCKLVLSNGTTCREWIPGLCRLVEAQGSTTIYQEEN